MWCVDWTVIVLHLLESQGWFLDPRTCFLEPLTCFLNPLICFLEKCRAISLVNWFLSWTNLTKVLMFFSEVLHFSVSSYRISWTSWHVSWCRDAIMHKFYTSNSKCRTITQANQNTTFPAKKCCVILLLPVYSRCDSWCGSGCGRGCGSVRGICLGLWTIKTIHNSRNIWKKWVWQWKWVLQWAWQWVCRCWASVHTQVPN